MSSQVLPILSQQVPLFAEVRQLHPNGKLAGLDVGSKTIGLASSDPAWQWAMPAHTLKRSKWQADVQALANWCHERQIVGLIIGWPLNMDGSQGPRCQSIAQFVANLQQSPVSFGPNGLPVIGLWDERLSTAATQRHLIETADASRATRARVVDALAAQYILEGALQFLQRQFLQ